MIAQQALISVALVIFLIGAIPIPSRINLVSLGLMLYMLALLIK